MCQNIPEVEKRQPANGFPKGLLFVFEMTDQHTDLGIHPDISPSKNR